MKKTYTGGCQCGKVRYEAQDHVQLLALPQGGSVAIRGRDVGLQAAVGRK
jgi:hypothetical protein